MGNSRPGIAPLAVVPDLSREVDRLIERMIEAGWKPAEIRREWNGSLNQAWAVMRPDPEPSLFDLTESG